MRYVEDDTRVILKPDGRLAINDYGDEVGLQNCIPVFFPFEDNTFYVDEVGGQHDSGCGWDPTGEPCGECSNISCSQCDGWKRREETIERHD